MMQTQSAFNLKYENCRRTPTTSTATLASNRNISDNASDIADAEYVAKNIPKMELLKINYVNKSLGNLAAIGADELDKIERPALPRRRMHNKPQAPRPHSEGALKTSELAKLSNATAVAGNATVASSSSPIVSSQQHRTLGPQSLPPTQHHHPLKYTVYKKHNEPSPRATKLQYTNNEDFFKSKKKYLVFDSKKRSALDNIQFYFDSKSYERHVDNKMYGILSGGGHGGGCDGGSSKASSETASTGSSHSWNFIKSSKTTSNSGARGAIEQKIAKKVPLNGKGMTRESSLLDIARIAKNFRANRSASSDSILQSAGKNAHARKEADKAAISMGKSNKLESKNDEKNCVCVRKSQTKRNDVMHIKINEMPNSSQIYAMPNGNNHRPKSLMAQKTVETQTPSNDEGNGGHHHHHHHHLHHSHAGNVADCKITAGLDKSIVNIEYGGKQHAGIATAPSAGGGAHSKLLLSNKTTCGYKNCTFVNCPMSPPASATEDNVCQLSAKVAHHENAIRRKTMHSISITKIDTISNKSKLYLKTKEFNDDDDEMDDNLSVDFSAVTLNNLRNLGLSDKKRGNIGGPTTIPIKFTPNNQNLNNSIKCKSVNKANFISTQTSIENRKYNNLSAAPLSLPSFAVPMQMSKPQLASDTNRVKIFIRNPPSMSSSDVSSRASSSSDSSHESHGNLSACKNYRMTDFRDYDRVADSSSLLMANDCSTTSSSSVMSSSIVDVPDSATKLSSHLRDLFPTRLGCDGAIFWNDCYYYDEHALCDCRANDVSATDGDNAKGAVTVLCSCTVDIKKVLNIFIKLYCGKGYFGWGSNKLLNQKTDENV